MKPVNSKRQYLQVPFKEGLHVKMMVVFEDLFDYKLTFALAAPIQGQQREMTSEGIATEKALPIRRLMMQGGAIRGMHFNCFSNLEAIWAVSNQ